MQRPGPPAERQAARPLLCRVPGRAGAGAARAGRAAAAAAGPDAAAAAAGGRVRPAARLRRQRGGHPLLAAPVGARPRRGRAGQARARDVQGECGAGGGECGRDAGEGAAAGGGRQGAGAVRAAARLAQRQLAEAPHLRGQSDAAGHGPDQLLQVHGPGRKCLFESVYFCDGSRVVHRL